MNPFKPLEDLLDANLVSTPHNANGLQELRLTESGGGAKRSRVEIWGVSQHSILVKMDATDQPSRLFKKESGARKRCDYALFTVHNKKRFLLFVELKSGRVCCNEIAQQFRGAKCLIKYCDVVLRDIRNQSGILDTCEVRYVVVYKQRIKKKGTRNTTPVANGNNTNPQKPYLLSSNRVCLKNLI